MDTTTIKKAKIYFISRKYQYRYLVKNPSLYNYLFLNYLYITYKKNVENKTFLYIDCYYILGNFNSIGKFCQLKVQFIYDI